MVVELKCWMSKCVSMRVQRRVVVVRVEEGVHRVEAKSKGEEWEER